VHRGAAVKVRKAPTKEQVREECQDWAYLLLRIYQKKKSSDKKR
jgi:hypothetical protein